MEFKKRKADLQLTADNYEDEASTSYGGEVPTKTDTDSAVPETKGDDAPVEEVKPTVAPVLGGFSSYAKTNPFAQAMANSGKNSFASTPLSSFGAISASKSNFNMPPPLVLPSPKSPKANPFSSPSPANTQFVTIVDNNDLLWKTMANDKLSADETAKSNTFQDNKTTSFRSAFFGGNSHNSSFASVTAASANTTTPSVFGGSSSASSSSGALAPQSAFGGSAVQDDDAGDDENDEDNDNNDGDASPTAGAGQASMKIISLPENVKLVTGEEEDVCLLQFRAKLYRLNTGAPAVSAVPAVPVAAVSSVTITPDATSTPATTDKTDKTDAPAVGLLQRQLSSYEDNTATANSVLESVIQEKESKNKSSAKDTAAKAAEWVEVGIGPLKILSSKNSDSAEGVSSGRLVMRREDKQNGLGTKLLLNVRLNRLLKVTRQSDKMVQLVCVNYADVQNNTAAAATIGTYLVKTKTTEEADDIYEIATDFVTKSIAADEASSSEGSTPTDEQA